MIASTWTAAPRRPGYREKGKLHREQQHQHQSEPEDGNRDSCRGRHHADVSRPSCPVPRRRGPRGPMPPAMAMIIAAKVSSQVAGKRCRISVLISSWVRKDRPRSPQRRSPKNRANCTWKGWSRPISRRSAAMLAASARSPSMICAGSPGTRWIIRNTRREIPTSVGTSSASRRRTKPVNGVLRQTAPGGRSVREDYAVEPLAAGRMQPRSPARSTGRPRSGWRAPAEPTGHPCG